IPAFGAIVLASRRIFWPKFQTEPYLQLDDLERAIELSTSDADLVAQERRLLQNIVALSDIRADELMRPRTKCLSFASPVSLSDLKGTLPPSGYVLVTEPDSDDIAAAIPVQRIAVLPQKRLDRLAEPIVYVPWCTSAAQVFEEMRRSNRRVAAVVHEFGETIGIITFDDIVASLFAADSARSERLLHQSPVERLGDDHWRINGMTSLRRVSKHLEKSLSESRGVTVSGLMQELLQAFPAPGDEVEFGGFAWKVIEVGPRGDMTVDVRRLPTAEDRT
ncbi:MAG: CBS domain-containing protein, partial [Planctomycetales bacterium]|nr:CBS domain-containing protein [Planctomycetales bacterium]